MEYQKLQDRLSTYNQRLRRLEIQNTKNEADILAYIKNLETLLKVPTKEKDYQVHPCKKRKSIAARQATTTSFE